VNTDFEDRLAQLLNESVDARLGARRAAPPFEAAPGGAAPVDELVERRRRRFTFLAVAATVAAVLVAALALHAFAPGGGHHTPATNFSPTPPNPQPSPSPTPKPTPNELSAVSLVLPKGWVARSYRGYLPKGTGTLYTHVECLTPSSRPVSTAPNACPVTFGSVTGKDAAVDPDEQGGLPGDAEYCFQGQQLASDHASGSISDFGGRPAFYFREDISCTTGQSIHFAQYVVAGLPAYVLATASSTSSTRSAMRLIATKSTLPPQTSALLLADVGRVTSLTGSGSTVHLTLARAYPNAQTANTRYIEIPGQRASYTVTSGQLHNGALHGPIRVGSVVKIQTNGSAVTDVLGQYEK
jgi:hypothetical protein